MQQRYLATHPSSNPGEKDYWLISKGPWVESTLRQHAVWLSEKEKEQHILDRPKSNWTYIPWMPQGPWTMYASPDLKYIFPQKLQLSLCGCRDPITVTLHEGGDYVGWISAGDEDPLPTMIFDHMDLLDVCFQCGVKYAVERGDGYIISLRIERS